MSFPDDIRMSDHRENWPVSRLKGVISDLMEEDDIEGVILIDGKEIIVTGGFPEEKNFFWELSCILSQVEEWNGSALGITRNGMFDHCILDHNGSKVLAKKMDNKLTLLVKLSSQGYIGPAMLDIENSIMKIDEILRVSVS